MPNITRTAELLAAIASAALITSPAAAADYYAGKTIELVVGGDAGGGYDIYARAVARHLAGHIPGNPTIVVKNMPGAGSTRAGIYISTIAPKDGTSIGALMPGAIIGPLLDDKPNLQFDPTKVLYIGTADSGVRVCATYATSKIKTFEDAQKQKTVLGASSAGGATRDYAYMHNHTAGAKFEVVSGYKGTVDVGLAMERGEVDGMCGWDWSSVKSQKSDWISEKKVNVLVQVSLEPLEELTERGVPHIWTFVPKENDRKVAELVVSQQVFQRSYIAPPQTPAEPLGILRTAFDATMKDPAFLEDAAKSSMDISASTGEEAQKFSDMIANTAPAVIARAKVILDVK
jgi:tripartite-type tricarboxylate transporter receptor subunit TctC